MSYDYGYKIITIGDSGVGKTTCIEQYANNNYLNIHMATIGVEYFSKVIEIEVPSTSTSTSINGNSTKKIKLQIWDTAGQELFRSIVRTYYRSVVGVVLFFDTTDMSSFKNIKSWLETLKPEVSEPVYCLIGTKVDKTSHRAVSYEQAKQFADMNNMSYYEISCSPYNTNISNINIAFQDLAKRIYQQNPDVKIEKSIGITLPIIPITHNITKYNKNCCIIS